MCFALPAAPIARLPVQLCPRHRNPMRVTALVHSSPLSQCGPDMCTQSFCEYFTSLKFLSSPTISISEIQMDIFKEHLILVCTNRGFINILNKVTGVEVFRYDSQIAETLSFPYHQFEKFQIYILVA